MKKLGGLVLIILGFMIAIGGANSQTAIFSGIIVAIVGLITTWSAEGKK